MVDSIRELLLYDCPLVLPVPPIVICCWLLHPLKSTST